MPQEVAYTIPQRSEQELKKRQQGSLYKNNEKEMGQEKDLSSEPRHE